MHLTAIMHHSIKVDHGTTASLTAMVNIKEINHVIIIMDIDLIMIVMTQTKPNQIKSNQINAAQLNSPSTNHIIHCM